MFSERGIFPHLTPGAIDRSGHIYRQDVILDICLLYIAMSSCDPEGALELGPVSAIQAFSEIFLFFAKLSYSQF